MGDTTEGSSLLQNQSDTFLIQLDLYFQFSIYFVVETFLNNNFHYY